MAVGHFFFSGEVYHLLLPDAPELLIWGMLLATSAAFVALGLWVFFIRQNEAPDDGFLAISLHALRQYLASREDAVTSRPPHAPHESREEQPDKAILAKPPDSPFDATDAGKQPEAPGDAMTDSPKPDPSKADEDVSWLDRHWFWGAAVTRFGREAAEGPVAVIKIITVFFLISVFWALFDQHSSSWIRQAEMMDRHFMGHEFLPSEIPALNPLMVMVLIPVMNLLYQFLEKRGIETSPLRRITVGMMVAAASFAFVAILQGWIDMAGTGQVWFAWQVIPYLVITTAEVMVSITGLEFAYTQAPKRMKSTIMGFWLLTVALGNVLVALLARFGNLPLVGFFWVFAGLMAGAGVLFGIRAYFYVQKDYAQE